MKNITIDYAKKTIEITKSFEKQAREYGSDAYKALRDVRKEFEGFELVVTKDLGGAGLSLAKILAILGKDISVSSRMR